MPKSRLRRKSDYTPPPAPSSGPSGSSVSSVKLKSGRGWVAPLMLAFFVIGLVWIVVYYVTTSQWPIQSLGNWNIVIGFGFIAAGFGVSTQWK